MTDKRRRFVELLAHGSSMAAACREVGVGRSTGNIWKNGTVVRRKDGTVKIVPPLEPLAVRTISPVCCVTAEHLNQRHRGRS